MNSYFLFVLVFIFKFFLYIFVDIAYIYMCQKLYKVSVFLIIFEQKELLTFFGINDYIYGSLFKDRGKLYNLIRIGRHQFYLHSLCTCILELTTHIYCFETFSSKIVFKFTKVYIVELSHTVCKSYILCKNVFSTSVVLLL